MSKSVSVLTQYFGFDSFREGQEGVIDAVISGRDALAVMPTGAGKSLCFQLPALILDGVTIVVSPLISLMRDQVQSLVTEGIPAAYINSSLTQGQVAKVIRNAAEGKYKLIYVAPERLLTRSIYELVQCIDISFLAVDEAHCISQWGQDFRPSYLDIPRFIESLLKRPVVAAFTATATPRVRKDISDALILHNPFTIITGFDRPNLYFEVRKPSKKYPALLSYLNTTNGNGIIYCSTRKEVERVTERLRQDKISAVRYHAGLTDYERATAQDDFLYDRVRVIVATNAFGMGIDKSNVRFVIHYNMPQNIESYYQEAGRAGRDGLESYCILFFNYSDIITANFLIDKSENKEEIKRNRQLLDKIKQYCETTTCLRSYILNYFGEKHTGNCDNCSNCITSKTNQKTDITEDAQKVLSCIVRVTNAGSPANIQTIKNIVKGVKDDYLILSELHKLPTFGVMRGAESVYLDKIFAELAAGGYIEYSEIIPPEVILTQSARNVLFGNTKVFIIDENA
ncbi:MAG: RecQ family ATP-dependent DNA helicase, partial [Clostridiales bacterium]|nr:RecQ family ATP-dependent DNA helicase [Clostridiales bacterium]